MFKKFLIFIFAICYFSISYSNEINEILGKLENQEGNLEDYQSDYLRLVHLNKYVDELFKKKFKEISQSKKND